MTPPGLSWVRAHLTVRSASVSVLTVAAVGLVAAIVLSDGYHTRSYELEESSVWVTSASQNAAGRINTEVGSQEDSLALPTDGSARLDVHQDGRSVFVDTGTELVRIDAATVTESARTPLFDGAAVDVAGGRAVISNPTTGQVWIYEADALTKVDVDGDAPAMQLGAVPPESVGTSDLVAVGGDGTVAGYSTEAHQVIVMSRTAERRVLDVGAPIADVQVSVAGDAPLVLDRVRSLLHDDGPKPVDLSRYGSGPQLQLQLPGDDPSQALVGTPSGLIAVELSTGKVTELAAADPISGPPVRPARVAGCSYGAWREPAVELVACDGWADPIRVDLSRLSGEPDGLAGDLRFRINRRNVVLNVLESGQTFQLVDKTLARVDDWSDQTDKKPNEGDGQDAEVLGIQTEPKPPVAEDDEFGARPMLPVVLGVLDNDSDPNGDPLTVTAIDPVEPSDAAQASIVRGGQAVQITAAAGTQGTTVSFRYTISDGRESRSANVRVRIRADDENHAPEMKKDASGTDRHPQMEIASGATASYDVLQDWVDMDGDPLVLARASLAPTSPGASEGSDTVHWSPDGVVTFVDGAVQVGTKSVDVAVSDTREESLGALSVSVKAGSEPMPPLARPDAARATVGAPVTIFPLVNDFSGRGGALRLVEVISGELSADASAQANLAAGTVTFTAAKVGSYSFGYTVSDGAEQATGRIRVDVVALDVNRPPAASLDLVIVPVGGERTVDLLLNDTDPDGDVMAVTAIAATDDSGVSTSLRDHRLLTVALDRTLDAPVRLDYELTDGVNPAVKGEVLVLMAPPAVQAEPPRTSTDRAVVRVGDVVDIAVLANDVDPSGSELTLGTDLAEPPGTGVAVIAGSVLRYQAPETATTVRLVYLALAQNGQSARGVVEIDVRGDVSNAMPNPPTVDARVVAGRTVTIPVPLAGIDPDGDSVVLDGLASAPRSGRISMPMGIDSLEYISFDDAQSGLDTFSYRVRDRRGAEATGQVRILVMPGAPNQVPVTVDDQIEIAPGAEVQLAVLANDRDPDGDPISFDAARPLQVTDGIQADMAGERLVVRAGNAEGDFAVSYHVSDGEGVSVRAGVVSVRVRSGATGMAPIARDDEALPTPGAVKVTLRPADNDIDPDGDSRTLKVSLPEGHPSWASATNGSEVVAELGEQPRSLAYVVTDSQQNTALGFIHLPAIGAVSNRPPEVITDAPELRVAAGEVLKIVLADHVRDPDGGTVRLTGGQGVSATRSDVATPLWLDENTMQYMGPADWWGQAAISFEVADGPEGVDGTRTTVLSLPITVEPPKGTNPPPQVNGEPSISLVRGGPERSVDLARFVRDIGDEASLRWTREVDGAPESVSASIRGSVLTVSASDSAAAGRSTLTYTVSDGENEPVQGTIGIEVSEPVTDPPRAVDDQATTSAGTAVTIRNVAANDLPSGGVELVSARGGAFGSVSVSGGDVEYVPSDGFFGVAQLTYTIRETGGSGRTAEGVIRVAVKATPAAPSRPELRARSNGRVDLAWTAPDARGSTITGYRLSWDGGSQECDSTTCAVSGLQNGTPYRFKVLAHSDAGDSPESALSEAITPETVPDAPTGVSLRFDLASPDGRLIASWDATDSPGSPIVNYRLSLTPALPTGPILVDGGQRSYVLSGLQNGVPYTVKVEAINESGSSAPSASSPSATPARQPDPPAAPTVSLDPDLGTLTAFWSASSFDGGSPITGYNLVVFRSGSEIRSIPITEGLSFTLADAEFGATHTFAVSAVSSVGTSALSPQSKPAQLKGVPGVIQSLRTAPTSAPNELTLTFDPPETNGHVLVGYWYYTRDVGQAILAPTDSHRLGLGDRTIVVDYIGVSDTIVTLGACYAEDIEVDAGQREMTTPPGCDGRVVESNRQSPLWPPAMPTLDVSQEDEQVVFTLSGNDNGSPITSYQYAVDDMFGVRHEVPDGNQLRLRRGDGTIHEIFFFAVNAIGGSLPTGLTHAHVDVAWPQ